MRQRTILFICLLMAALNSWADKWVPKTSQDCPNEKAIWGTLTIKGVAFDKPAEIAAFIGEDDCRGQVVLDPGETNFILRVAGELTAAKDLNKTITFKVFYDGLTYTFNATKVFDNENGANVALILDAFRGITMPDTIEVTGPEGNWPLDYPAGYSAFLYGDNIDGTQVNSAHDDLMTFYWDYANSSSYFTVTDNVLHATNVTPAEGAYLGVEVRGPVYPGDAGPTCFSASTSTIVKVTVQVIPVTSIVLAPTSITVEVDDDLTKALAAVTPTALPNDATNKTINWQLKDGEGEWVSMTNMAVTTPGTWHIVYYSESNPEVTTELTVNVPVPVGFDVPGSMTFYTYQDATVTLTNFVGDNFNPDLLDFAVTDTTGMKDTYFKVTSITANPVANTITCTVKGKYVFNGELMVSYNGKLMNKGLAVPFSINAGVVLPSDGWSWISANYIPSGQEAILLKPDTSWIANMANVLEIRSQRQLLYNDAQYGVFGKLKTLTPVAGMYKVRGKGASALPNVIDLGGFATPASKVDLSSFKPKKGYNWMTYPNEFDLELSEINEQLSATAVEGDMIIGQTSYAVFDEGQNKWVGSNGFKFEAGKGYIYYTEYDSIPAPDFSFNGIPLCYQDVPAGARQMRFHPWRLQNLGFADNMPVVARIEGLAHPENYMLGAFIDGECRGEGQVAVRDIMLINVAGKAGDQVTFRLYDMMTEEEIVLDEAVSYTSMIGSMKAPMAFTAPAVTGISSQPVAKTHQKQNIYTLGGQRLSSPRKGVNIVNGKIVVF